MDNTYTFQVGGPVTDAERAEMDAPPIYTLEQIKEWGDENQALLQDLCDKARAALSAMFPAAAPELAHLTEAAKAYLALQHTRMNAGIFGTSNAGPAAQGPTPEAK